ncbi:hypothetical protein [Tardiphaga sp.]|uniref:hypothetical protein n=1 Tax=Tardiphaga sp. TaxID=1926292 RepID=UPI00262113DC|nr:hypothetical protein [Tardiphaga sp.]MDB5617444.1 hypothetical protein [Tardiphaga sp.]
MNKFQLGTVSAVQQDAEKAFKPTEVKPAKTEFEISQQAFDDNRARLRAERLAREAATLQGK